ncbi:MAG: TolC family protein [Candidatus Aminicenantaceae bacterium]
MAKRNFVWLAILLITPALVTAQAPGDQSMKLSLQECLAKAMRNNLGVAVQMLTPELGEAAVAQANEKFLPSVTLDFGRQSTQNASSNFLDAADVATNNYNIYSGTFNQQIPGGGNLSMRLNASRYDTNRTGQTVNPRYNSELRFSFTQPLLKNFGLKTSKREIIVAKTRLNQSEKDLERSLQQTVYNVEQAYWNLVYAMENYEVTEQSLKYAQDLLERNQRSVEVGTMAPIEIISAEAEVARLEASMLVAEAQIRNEEDRLKQILNLRAEDPQADLIRIEPTDVPEERLSEVSLDEALNTALQNRPDLASTRLGIQNSEFDVRYQKNQLLPNLSFDASYWSPGLSGTQLILNPDDPFGPALAQIPGGITDSFKDVFGFTYKNWAMGLTLDIPFNAIFSRAALAQAQINLDSALLQLKEQELQIYTDIKIAVRNVETAYKTIQALKIARQLSERQLEAVTEKLKVGLSTNFEVLQYQRDLSSAQASELNAVIQYNMALAALERDMGVSLDRNNVTIANPTGGR